MRNRRRRATGDAQLLMTPMIDVVFLLLIFFIAVASESIPLGILDISQGRAEAGVGSMDIRVGVLPHGYTIDGMPVGSSQLDAALASIARRSKRLKVVIDCSDQSRHENLVEALDLCARHELTQVAVVRKPGP